MNANEAAEKVLAEAGKPLHYFEITKLIIVQGLWQTTGKTPEATVNADLAMEIKEKGEQSCFQRTAPGTYALRSWGLPIFKGKGSASKPKPEKSGPIRVPNQTDPLPIPVALADAGKPRIKTLTFNDAAEVVLEKYANGQPMHYGKITEKILELGLVYTEGQTPEATLYAQILTEINRNIKRGETPRFVKHGKGLVGLQKWLGEGLAYQIKAHNAEVRKKLHKRLFSISPKEFEELIGRLLVALGFQDVTVTNISNDGGIDVFGTLVVGDVIRTRMAVQAKRWKKNVQAPVVQQVRGSLSTHEQGLIITTSDFSKGAYEEAQKPDKIPVALMNGAQLVGLLIENDVGILRTPYDLIDMEEAETEG